jgi:hypothetical protein
MVNFFSIQINIYSLTNKTMKSTSQIYFQKAYSWSAEQDEKSVPETHNEQN